MFSTFVFYYLAVTKEVGIYPCFLYTKSTIKPSKRQNAPAPSPLCTWDALTSSGHLNKVFCRRIRHYLQLMVDKSTSWSLQSLVNTGLRGSHFEQAFAGIYLLVGHFFMRKGVLWWKRQWRRLYKWGSNLSRPVWGNHWVVRWRFLPAVEKIRIDDQLFSCVPKGGGISQG